MNWIEEIKKLGYRAGSYNNLPAETKLIVDEWYESEALIEVKAEIKRRGNISGRINAPTERKLRDALQERKLTNEYYVNNHGGFEGPYRTGGYSSEQIGAGEADKALRNAKYFAGKQKEGESLPPPDEEVYIEPSFYEALEEEIKEIGHPMKYPERRAAWEKNIDRIEEHINNHAMDLTGEDLQMLEKFKEIMSGGDYAPHTYEDETGKTKIGRSSKTTGAKGRHMDRINGLIDAVKSLIDDSEHKSWQETLKAKQSLADYITRILEEMGYDANQIKVS